MTTYSIIYSGIYGIVNLTNDKLYIGSAVNLKLRRHNHFRKLRGKKHPSNHLQLSWNKYGEENFKFLFLEICFKEELLTKEKEWIDLLEVYNPKNGYNKRKIPNSNLGMKLSEEHKRKISLGNMGIQRNLGRKHTDETKLKVSIANKGRKHSPEHIAKRMSYKIGVSRSEETKKKISETLKQTSYFKNRTLSQEILDKRVATKKSKSRWKCLDGSKCKCEKCNAVRKHERHLRHLNEYKRIEASFTIL